MTNELVTGSTTPTSTARLCSSIERTRRVPTLYYLTNLGADLVEHATGQRPLRVLNSDPQPLTFLHRWEGVATRLAFDDSCKCSGLTPPLWFLESDVNPDAPGSLPPNQRSLLYHTFGPKKPTCRPDLACQLTIPPDTQLIVFWEIDRSTMGGKQLIRKGLGYESLLSTQQYTRYFSDLTKPAVRIFWLVPSLERISTVLAASVPTDIATRYRFLVQSARYESNLLTDPVWYCPDGSRVSIYVP